MTPALVDRSQKALKLKKNRFFNKINLWTENSRLCPFFISDFETGIFGGKIAQKKKIMRYPWGKIFYTAFLKTNEKIAFFSLLTPYFFVFPKFFKENFFCKYEKGQIRNFGNILGRIFFQKIHFLWNRCILKFLNR